MTKKRQREPLTWKGTKIRFNWEREEWEQTYWPIINHAIKALAMDDAELQATMANVVKQGRAHDLLEGLCLTKEHLRGLAEACEIALHRSFEVLERLGYAPDNPPPESRVH